jgi:hypothetical protein
MNVMSNTTRENQGRPQKTRHKPQSLLEFMGVGGALSNNPTDGSAIAGAEGSSVPVDWEGGMRIHGATVFTIPKEYFDKVLYARGKKKGAKWAEILPAECPHYEDIRALSVKKPKEDIILWCRECGSMCYLKRASSPDWKG